MPASSLCISVVKKVIIGRKSKNYVVKCREFVVFIFVIFIVVIFVVFIFEQLEEIVTNSISTMPLEDKVAGLFVITPEPPSSSTARNIGYLLIGTVFASISLNWSLSKILFSKLSGRNSVSCRSGSRRCCRRT